MAFDFLGTIEGLDKFEELEEFVRIESREIDKKIDHLNKQKNRMYEILDKFKVSDQYLRKDYPLSERSDIDYIKNPRPSKSTPPPSLDALNALDVGKMKKFVLDNIKYKKENNEFKIKKIRDKIEQIDKEIVFLTETLETFEDTLNRIRSRFNLDDFEEVQEVADLDPKDVDDSIPVTRRDAGRVEINGGTFYLISTVRSFNKTITFDTNLPTIKPFDKIVLTNGQNNGTYTVARILTSTTLEVVEDLVDESPSTSRAAIP